MAFSGSVVLLLVAYGIACAVLIIGTASPDWAHIKSDLPFTAPWNTSSEVATDNYVDEDAVPTSTGSGESDRYVTDWSISPFGYSDNNADNFYWIRPNCRIYDEDYDFVGVLSTNGQCDEQRTMQIFALFAIFFSFFAFISLFLFGMGKTPKQNPLVFSLLASICGIISMSIFVDQKQHRRGDFFKAGTDKFTYGYSMGLFTAGWVLSIVNTALTAQAKLGGEGDKANLTGIRPLQAILIFSFFIAFCTIVIGTGSPEWAYRRVDGEIDVSPFGFYVQSEGRFYWLRPNCKIYEPDGSLYEPMPTIPTRSLCDEFRTQQVFAIFACVLSFLGLVSALVHSYHKGGNVGPVLFGFLTGVAGVTAMAMFIDQKDGSRGFFEQDGGDKWDYGYSIGLFTGGWILALVAGIIALFSKKNDEYAAPGQSQPNTANTSIQSGV